MRTRSTNSFLSVLFAFASLGMATSVNAENWPRYRGPGGQGISGEQNLPLEWNATNNIAWKTLLPGDGWSSPIVWGDRVFVTATTQGGIKCHVLCVDRKKGAVIWNTEVFEQTPIRKEGKNSYSTPTACTDGERVYAVFNDGSMAAVTFSGQVAWTNREVQFYSRHGLGASPIIYNGLVIMPYDGSMRVAVAGNYPNNTDEERTGWQIPWDKSFIAALDTKTGKRVWTATRGKSRIAHVTPLIFRVGSDDQLISSAGDCIQGFNPNTGERIWSVYSKGEGATPSPSAGDGLVFASSGFEASTMRAVRPDGRGEVTQTHIAWEQKKGTPTQASTLYVKPYLYAVTDSGMVTCYKAESGDIVYQERVGGNFCASPVYADGRLFFLSESGETVVVQAGPDFKILARNPLNKEKTQASMAVSQGNFFIRSGSVLYCIGKTM